MKVKVPKNSIPVLVAIADVHRTNQRPICRSEPDIMEVQDAKLNEVINYAKKKGVPLVSAGDTFDTWKCGHDVVNSTLALTKAVDFRACYGQHELPSHDISEAWRSPATTLLLSPQSDIMAFRGNFVRLHFCHWGQKPKLGMTQPVPDRRIYHVLVIHKTVWMNEAPYPGAKGNVKKLIHRPEYAQFDAIISGDNHSFFVIKRKHEDGHTTIWLNCGCLYRTDAKEKNFHPMYHLLFLFHGGNGFGVKSIPVKAFNPDHVTRKHLEVKDKEREWDSDFANSIAKVKGARPSSFVEDLKKASLSDPKDQRKRMWNCVDDVMPF